MFGMYDVGVAGCWDAECWGCGMLELWDVAKWDYGDEGCLESGMLKM